MARTTTGGKNLRQASPGDNGGQSPFELIDHLHNSGGVFLPDYDHEVRSIDQRGSDTCRYGDLEFSVATMDDKNGTQYDVISGTPSNIRSDTAIVSTTAWWTGPNLEHNLKTVRSALWLGYPVILVGPPRNRRDNLSRSTYDIQRILDSVLSESDVEPNQAIVLGASRAAMIGMGLTVEQYSGGRKIPYADLTAPCVPRPFTLREWPKVLGQFGVEAAASPKLIFEYGLTGELGKYLLSTIPSLDRRQIAGFLKTTPTLISGQPGKFAGLSDPDTYMHIQHFEDDFWALSKVWENIFSERTNVRMRQEPGSHVGGIAKRQTRRRINARLARLAEGRGNDGVFTRKLLKEVIEIDIPLEGYNVPGHEQPLFEEAA